MPRHPLCHTVRWMSAVRMLLVVAGSLVALSASPAQPPGSLESQDDVPSEKPVLALDSGGHTNAVYKLVTTQYADQLISVGLDKTIRFWDLATGDPVRVLRPPLGRGAFGYLYCAAISPDGRLLAVSGYRAQTPLYDHRIHLIALPEGTIVRSLKGHAYAIYDMAFSHAGGQLASASHDGTVRIWDAASGGTIKTLKGHTGVVHAVAWSADDKRLVSGSLDKTARIWSVATGASEAVMRESRGDLNTVDWSPDGRSIATGSTEHAIRLYEPSGKLRYAWPKVPNEVMSVAFSPDSKRLLYTFGSNLQPPIGAAVLDMVDGHEIRRYTGHENSPICGIFLRDGKQVATGDTVSGIRIWNADTGATVRRLEGQGKVKVGAGWSPDGQAVAWGNSTKENRTDTGANLERTFCFNQLDFGPPPDKSFVKNRARLGNLSIGIVTENGVFNMRKVAIERGGAIVTTYTLGQPYDQVRAYSLLNDSRAVVGTKDGAYVFDSNTGLAQHELKDRGEDVWGLAPSPDFRYLLTTGNDQIIKVWNIDAGELLVSLFVAGDEWVAWTPQGYYAASLAGESLMGWHINQGPTQMAAFYPASRFHKSLYRPDVIRRLLSCGDMYRALELADQERTIQSQRLVVADVLPPKVTISEPSEPQVDLQEPSLKVRAVATPADNDPLTALRLIVNGRPYGAPLPIEQAAPGPIDAAPQGGSATVEREWTVKLPPGKHQIVVKAETAESYGLSSPVEVSQSTSAAAPAEAATSAGESSEGAKPDAAAPAGKLYVLAIGAAPGGAGANPSQDAKDARSIAAALEKAGKNQFDAVVTRVLTDQQATPAAIAAELEQMRSAMTLADTGIIYYAAQSSANPQGEYMLGAGHSAAGEVAEETSGTKLKAQLAAIQGRLVLMLDTVQADEHARRDAAGGYCGSADKQHGGSNLDVVESEWLRELLTEDYGVVVISASRKAIAAKSATAAGQSPLSQAISEGIGGRADADKDGTVSLQELGPYLTERIRALTGGKQTPTIERPRGMLWFPLAKPGVAVAEPALPAPKAQP
jgi:WD40 repeat protein